MFSFVHFFVDFVVGNLESLPGVVGRSERPRTRSRSREEPDGRARLMMLKEREKPAASRCAGGAGGGSGNAGGTRGGVGRLYGATKACEGRGCTVCVCYEAGA